MMGIQRKKLVIFDLDGTLNRTELFSLRSMRHALAEYGRGDVSDEELISQIGGASFDYARHFLPDADEKTCEKFIARTEELDQVYMRRYHGSFEGIAELLDRLHGAGYMTAVCSNAYISYIASILSLLDLAGRIDEIQPLEPGRDKTYTMGKLLARVQPERAVMVGDRVFDKEAAWNNKLPFIGCLYGFAPAEMADAQRTVHSAGEIFDAVEALIGLGG